MQGHYDYRHLRLPEALAQYAFRLVAYGAPYLDDVATVATNTNAVEAATKQLRKEFQSQLTVPTVLKPSDPPALGYWNPDDPFTYPQRAHLPTDSVSVRDYLDIHLLDDAFDAAFDIHPASTIAQSPRGGRSVQSHDQTIYASSAALPSEQAPSSQLLGSAGRMSQDSGYSHRRRKNLIVDNYLQNVVHLPPSAKAYMMHIELVSPVRAL